MPHSFDNDELTQLAFELESIAYNTDADEYHISAGPMNEAAVSVTLRYETDTENTTAKDKIEEMNENEH